MGNWEKINRFLKAEFGKNGGITKRGEAICSTSKK